MVRYSYKTELDTYDKLTDNVASLIKQEIESDFQSLQVSADLEAKAGNLDEFNISANDFDTIKVQLKALGLIQHSNKQRSVKDKLTYWTLTPYGNNLMTKLRAIRRQ
jgi:hypothetical protein